MVDNHPCEIHGSHAAGESVPFDGQDTLRVRLRARIVERGCEAYQIRSVYVFLQRFSPTTSHSFHELDQSPPKRDLKVSDPNVRDLTLAELQLSPSSVLLLRFEDESMNREFSDERTREFVGKLCFF